uniref:Uncharacterized protein n=1 Tax=Arundo donax TaxID=35708 RepID=A0A0A9BY86_ARUDO
MMLTETAKPTLVFMFHLKPMLTFRPSKNDVAYFLFMTFRSPILCFVFLHPSFMPWPTESG